MNEVMLLLRKVMWVLWIMIIVLVGEIALLFHQVVVENHIQAEPIVLKTAVTTWRAPDISEVPPDSLGELIRYGRELIEHTASYLGPNGTVMRVSNGMNCQNCHLHAGTKAFAANYSAVASTYPRFRARSGTIEGFAKRINDCFERSLNGEGLPVDSREMKAIIAYLQWVGKDVPKGRSPQGAGLMALPWLNRAADPKRGRQAYQHYCAFCHGAHGEGVESVNDRGWKYPPLWGAHSYNTGAGLFRLSRFAAFIKANMPYGTTYENPVLSDEEAWDIAAYVNSMPRPHRDFPDDWPDLSQKPIDHPFGPYKDNFPVALHKYGPFSELKTLRKK